MILGVRKYLLEKGSCPQCGSEKSKNGDLLPNVALRQAIDRFTNAQLDTPLPNDGAGKMKTWKLMLFGFA